MPTSIRTGEGDRGSLLRQPATAGAQSNSGIVADRGELKTTTDQDPTLTSLHKCDNVRREAEAAPKILDPIADEIRTTDGRKAASMRSRLSRFPLLFEPCAAVGFPTKLESSRPGPRPLCSA